VRLAIRELRKNVALPKATVEALKVELDINSEADNRYAVLETRSNNGSPEQNKETIHLGQRRRVFSERQSNTGAAKAREMAAQPAQHTRQTKQKMC